MSYNNTLRRLTALLTSLCLAAQPLAAAAADYQYQVPFDAPDMSAATTGRLTATPSSHGFGTLVLGSTAVTSTTIKNSGQDSVHITGISVSAPFSQSNDCPAVLAGGQACQATVLFNPATAGTYSSALEVGTQESGASVSFGVSGNAVVPTTTLSVSPSSVIFGASDVGVTAAPKSLTITNDGNSPATVSGVSVSSGASDFNQSNNCSAPLAPGASCTVNIAFTPTVYGARTGGLSIYEEASGTLYSVALQGSGNAAVLAVAPASVAMPDTIVGYPTTTKVTVTNAGNLPMLAVSTNITGAGADFSIADSQCGASLAAGASCEVTVSFAPAAAGSKTASLTVATNNGGTKTVGLSGKGVAQAPDLTANPVAVTFAALEVGSTAPAQTITLTNHGNIPVTVSGLDVVTGASDFAQTNNCATVPVNGSCSINVQFTPALRGVRTGTVYLRYDTRDLTVALSGQGLQGVASPSTGSVDFGSVQVGQAATAQTITLTNTGDAPLVVQSATVPASDFNASTSCTTVAPGGNCSVAVAFTPSTLGSRTQTLTIATNAGNKTVALQGNGVKGNASVSPSSVTFQPTQVGSTATVQAVTVTNTGTNTLNITGVGVISGAADFAQSNNCASVPVNGTCTINVSFTPSASGSRTGMVAMTHDGDGVTTVALDGEGRNPSATLSAVSFATTHVGQSTTASATLTNSGIGTLTLTVPSAASVTGTDFSFVATTCASALASGATCSVTLRFAPTSTAARSGMLTIATNAGAQSATLAATGVQGTASASPSALTFAAQQVASTAPTQTVVVTNTGTSPLAFSGVSVVTGASDFAQSNNCASVPVNGSCSVVVSFTPTAAGARSGTVALTHDGDGLTTISLTGTGQAASASLSSVTFNTTQVGSSSTASATLTNTGIGTITLTAPSAASVTGTDFSFVSSTCSASLAAGATCATVVRFAPTSTTARTGSLSIGTQAGTQSTALSATGVQGTASVSPGSLTFATQQVSTTSSVQSVTVTNTGTSVLNFTGVSVVSGASDFAQSNNCASVAVNGTCTVNVSFTPSAAGSRTGTVALAHDGGGVSTVSLSGTGQAASASLTTPSFAATPVGSSSNATATLTNTGVGSISVTTPSAASVTGTSFSFVTTTCGTSLTAGANCTVTVKFSPTSTAAATGGLSVVTGAGTQSVTLGSTGIQGYANISPNSLTFAVQQVGSTATTQSVTVTNTGTNTLTFSGVGIASGASDFAQSNNCGSVAVNGTCTVNVNFTPTASGSRSGSLAFTHDGGGMATVSLTGTGQAASATLSSPSFPATSVGSNSTATATLTNTGIGVLSVTTPAAGSVTGTDFSFVSTTCGTSLSAGTNCTVTVKFAPTSNAARTGSLSFATGAGTMTATLSSTGIQGAASYSPTSLSYAAQQVGTSSAAKTVTLTNNGTATLTISGVSVTSGATDFSQSNNCASLAVNASCTLTVTFGPTAAGTRTGTVTVTHNGTGSTTVGLSGIGQSASASLTTPTFPATQVGSSNTATSTLSNTGIATISVTTPSTSSVTGTDFSFQSTTCGTSLAAGATCTVTVKFMPTSNAARTGSLAIATGAGTQTATLSATGSNPSIALIGSPSFSYNVAQNTGSGHYIGVQNNGAGPVTVNTLSYTSSAGAFNAWWSGTGTNGGYCANGFVLQPGESCGAWANSDGSNGEVSSGTATISTSAGNATFSGSFTVRGLTYSTATGATTAATGGQTGTIYTMSIVNSTPFAYYFPMYTVYGGATRIGRFTGGNASNFVITGTTCSGTLGAGSSCTVSIAATAVSSLTTYTTSFQPNGTFQQGGDGSGWSWTPGSWLINMGTTTADVYVSPANTVNVTAQAASLSLNSTSAAFGNVQVGQSAVSGTYTLTNSGNIAATGLAVNAGAGYSVTSNTCSTSLNAGANCTFTLTFAPTAAQAYNNNATVTSSAGTQTITVTGTGTNPSLVLSGWNTGGNAALGVVGYNSDSGRWPIYTNNGSGPITIVSHTATGAFWAWQGGGGYCYPGLTVAAGSSCVFFNGISSTGVGDYTGTSTVTYTGAGQSTQFSTGVPNYTVSIRTTTANVGSVAFGTVPQNQWNGPQTVTITNNATSNPLQNIAISFSGGNSGNFTTSGNTCGSSLAGGASCSIQVYFNPTWSANGFSSTLVVTGGYPRMQPADSGYIPSNTSVNIQIPVSGNGAYSQATLTSTAAQGFGGGWYGQGWSYLNYTYRNDGNTAMTLASPSLTAPLGVSSNSCSGIGAGASCTIQLYNAWNNDVAATSQSFTPSGATIAPASASASYTVYSAVPTWGTTSLSFGNVNVGSSAQQNITLYNYGANTAYNWAVNNSIANLPAGFSFNLSACSNVAPGSGGNAQGGSCNVVVTFSPTAAQSYGGGSIYVAAASRLNNTLTVSGTGVAANSVTFNPVSGTTLADSDASVSASATITGTMTWTVSTAVSSGTGLATNRNCTSGSSYTNTTCTISMYRTGSLSGSVKGTLTVTMGNGAVATYPFNLYSSGTNCCPASWQAIETLEKGYVPVAEVEAGMHVRAPDGERWVEVYGARDDSDIIWRMFVGGEALDVNQGHFVMMEDGTWKTVRDLKVGDRIKGQHGNVVTVEGLLELGEGSFRNLQVEGQGYQLGRTVGHNVTASC